MKSHSFTNASQQDLKLLKLVLKVFSEYFTCSPQNQSELARVTSFFLMTESKQVKKKIITVQNQNFQNGHDLKCPSCTDTLKSRQSHSFFQSCRSQPRYYANTAKLKAEFKTKKPRTENYPTVFHSKTEIRILNFIITFLYHFVLVNVCKYFSQQFYTDPNQYPAEILESPF